MAKRDITITDEGPEPSDARGDRSLGFIDPIRIGEALQLCDWGVEDEIQVLLDIIDNAAESSKSRMQAMNMLNGLVKDALKMSGVVGQATYRNDEGNSLTVQQVYNAVRKLPGDPNGTQQPDSPDDSSRTDDAGRLKPTTPAAEGHAAQEAQGEEGEEGEEGPQGEEEIIDIEAIPHNDDG